MPWPAWLGGDPSSGTCYIRGYRFGEIIGKHEQRGQAWKYRNKWTTYVPSRKLAYKNIDRLFPPTRNEERWHRKYEETFWNIMREAKDANIAPPTSGADLFQAVYRGRLCPGSLVHPFRSHRFGGWEALNRERLENGVYRGRLYHYDLNRAYRWSASCGLPNLQTAYYTRDFTKARAVYLAKVPAGVIPYRRVGGWTMLTSEERDFFGLDLLPIRFGVAFRSEVHFADTFDKIDKLFPTMAKRISQTFWGMWGTPVAPVQISWRHGEKMREMRNPFFNPIWAHYVLSRVKLRLSLHHHHAVRMYVDAIHTTDPLPVGTGHGEWKLVGQYDGAWFAAPNKWGPMHEARPVSRGSLKMLEATEFAA